jgi:hypothetical protein
MKPAMRRFLNFDPSNPYITPERMARAIAANLLVVLWAAGVVYLAFTDLPNAWVFFISFMFSYLINK